MSARLISSQNRDLMRDRHDAPIAHRLFSIFALELSDLGYDEPQKVGGSLPPGKPGA